MSLVEARVSEDYHQDCLRQGMAVGPKGRTPMEPMEQFGDNVRWTAAEKKAARKAFDRALKCNLEEIIEEAKRRMAKVNEPSDLWELEAYLTETRKTVNRVYQFRESRLLTVFSNLMGDGRLREGDFVGLQPEKIDRIKRAAQAFRSESEFQ
jgi:Photoprotection regulator fluorescence recovery protein